MRAYTICWTGLVALLAAGSGLAAALSSGWPALLATAGCAVLLGVMVGVVWAEEAGRRMVLRCALWSLAAALLVVGLPMQLGAWSLAVLAGVVATAPPVVTAAARLVRQRRAGASSAVDPPADRPVDRPVDRSADPRVGPLLDPARAAAEPPGDPLPRVDVSGLTDRELERRWHLTAARLRHPGTAVDAALDLVSERVELLDEIERRNPAHFAAVLDRAIWFSDDREGGSGG